jgi:SPOR domain
MTGIDGDRDQNEGQDDWQDGEGEPLETERLALDDEDERLPWLESASDDDEDDSSDEGTRMLGFFVMGLVALGVLVGAIWWATHRGSDAKLVADGSTVAAPAGPYKEAPKDPGGKTFAGTGDSSFAVSEGQTRPGKLAGAAPAPGAAATTKPVKVADAAAAPGASSGVGVQVGAFSSKATAEAGWTELTGQAGGVLSGVSHRVIEGQADNGTIFRLQAVAGDSGAAKALCASLKAKGIACQVK